MYEHRRPKDEVGFCVTSLKTDFDNICDLDLLLQGHIDYLNSLVVSTSHMLSLGQYKHPPSKKMKEEFALQAVRQILLYVTLGFDSNVKSVI